MAQRTITVAGGNLFRLAAKELGDALKWQQIAELNGLTDTRINGVKTLKLPNRDQSPNNGGILGEP